MLRQRSHSIFWHQCQKTNLHMKYANAASLPQHIGAMKPQHSPNVVTTTYLRAVILGCGRHTILMKKACDFKINKEFCAEQNRLQNNRSRHSFVLWMAAFKNQISLDQHLLQGSCEYKLEKGPLKDQAKVLYAQKLSNNVHHCPDMQAVLLENACTTDLSAKEIELLLTITRKLSQKYGRIYSLSLGPYWAVFINDTRSLHEAFVKHADIFSDRPDVFFFTKILGGKGIAAWNGASWKAQRTFTINALRHFGFGKRNMESKILEEVAFFMEVLESKKGSPVNIETNIREAVSNIICSIVFGKRFNYDDKIFQKLIKDLEDFFSNPFLRMVNWIPYLHYVSYIYDVFGTQKCINIVKDIKVQMANIIEEHKRTFEEDDLRDFIDAYLLEWQNHTRENKIQFSEDNLEAVVLDLFAAGTETTSSAILWAIIFLVNNPDVQQKMRNELTEVLGSNRQPLLTDRNNLPYCESVITETLRLGNIAPFSLPHTATEDFVINNYRIPKGSIVVPNMNATFHDENLFLDSNNFDPSRYLDENGKFNERRENVMPFSLAIVTRYKIIPVGQLPPNIEGKVGTTHSPTPYSVRFVDW
ncbi:CYP2J [Mytilus coruscus]|uniref:CYP2J n=1 Tax=Mytilus coruscus TaxID=42192 RepID=A0A6J8DXU4_MYTCO|nr:CYP2J [Mytilus coruscus]